MDRLSADESQATLDAAFEEHASAVADVALLANEVASAANIIAESLDSGGRLLVCGNGGSAADAQHMAAEMVGRYQRDREAWAAIALNTDSSAVTAIANDYGFERVFARQVEAYGRAGDALVAISTSGASANVLTAIAAARDKGMKVVGLTGGEGGEMVSACDVCLVVSSSSTARIQEVHALLIHVLCELVEDALS